MLVLNCGYFWVSTQNGEKVKDARLLKGLSGYVFDFRNNTGISFKGFSGGEEFRIGRYGFKGLVRDLWLEKMKLGIINKTLYDVRINDGSVDYLHFKSNKNLKFLLDGFNVRILRYSCDITKGNYWFSYFITRGKYDVSDLVVLFFKRYGNRVIRQIDFSWGRCEVIFSNFKTDIVLEFNLDEGIIDILKKSNKFSDVMNTIKLFYSNRFIKRRKYEVRS